MGKIIPESDNRHALNNHPPDKTPPIELNYLCCYRFNNWKTGNLVHHCCCQKALLTIYLIIERTDEKLLRNKTNYCFLLNRLFRIWTNSHFKRESYRRRVRKSFGICKYRSFKPPDSSVVTGGMSDLDGTFDFTANPGTYLFRVWFIGYERASLRQFPSANGHRKTWGT